MREPSGIKSGLECDLLRDHVLGVRPSRLNLTDRGARRPNGPKRVRVWLRSKSHGMRAPRHTELV
jgi:hypothetical protein